MKPRLVNIGSSNHLINITFQLINELRLKITFPLTVCITGDYSVLTLPREIDKTTYMYQLKK